MQSKVCKQCGEDKPLTREYWHVHEKCRGGFNSRCKDCVRNQRDHVRQEVFQEDGSIRRKCRRCQEEKPLTSEHWARHYSGVGGFRWECKECVNIRNISYYHTNKERYRAYVTGNNKKTRLQVLGHYSGGRLECACCGENGLEFLALDHINGGGNKHRKALGLQAGESFMRWLVKNNYPEGFRVLCHNCNLSHGYYGYCPHESPDLASSLYNVKAMKAHRARSTS